MPYLTGEGVLFLFVLHAVSRFFVFFAAFCFFPYFVLPPGQPAEPPCGMCGKSDARKRCMQCKTVHCELFGAARLRSPVFCPPTVTCMTALFGNIEGVWVGGEYVHSRKYSARKTGNVMLASPGNPLGFLFCYLPMTSAEYISMPLCLIQGRYGARTGVLVSKHLRISKRTLYFRT